MKPIITLLMCVFLVVGCTASEPVEPEDDTIDPPDLICIDQCGDGSCAEMVCMGSGCPCAEDSNTCPEDCT